MQRAGAGSLQSHSSSGEESGDPEEDDSESANTPRKRTARSSRAKRATPWSSPDIELFLSPKSEGGEGAGIAAGSGNFICNFALVSWQPAGKVTGTFL